jgi:hypothetical protein
VLIGPLYPEIGGGDQILKKENKNWKWLLVQIK